MIERSAPGLIVDIEDGVKKLSMIKLETVVLFSKDVLPMDMVGNLSEEAMLKVRAGIKTLDEANILKINKNNLPVVLDKKIQEANDKKHNISVKL